MHEWSDILLLVQSAGFSVGSKKKEKKDEKLKKVETFSSLHFVSLWLLHMYVVCAQFSKKVYFLYFWP